MDSSGDQLRPSEVELGEGQAEKELIAFDFVDKLRDLEAHPREGSKWKATRYSANKPISAYPDSPNPQDHVEGNIEVSLLAANSVPENPTLYEGQGFSYREGEEVVQGLDITRDRRTGRLVGVGSHIEYTHIYHEPQSFTGKQDGRIRQTRIGEKVILRSNGDVEIKDVVHVPEIVTSTQTQWEQAYSQRRALYGENDPQGQEIVRKIYNDLSATVDASTTNTSPVQASPAA